MESKRLRITPRVFADLRQILAYSGRTWGDAQAIEYGSILAAAINGIGENPGLGVMRPWVFPGCRAVNVKSHVIYYREVDEIVEILRILHQRQSTMGQFDMSGDK